MLVEGRGSWVLETSPTLLWPNPTATRLDVPDLMPLQFKIVYVM